MLDCQFCIHASKGPVIIVNQLKSVYNSPFKDSHSYPIHTCFLRIDSNVKIIDIFCEKRNFIVKLLESYNLLAKY